ncbi:MAG: DegV family protein [Eubacteriaceae bacterium]|nr:DegV family protein [Eubacteriaceae bacterium]
MGITIVSDTTSYLSPELQQEFNIKLVPLSVHFPDESFQEDQVDYDYFYNKIIKQNVIPTSSQPSSSELKAFFKEIIASGNDVIAVFISSTMSGTYNNAMNMKAELLSEFPNSKIEIIDSRTNCMALGTIALAAAKAVKAGMSFDWALEAAYQARDRVHFYFTPKTLEFLRKGGRIGTASALFGNVLNINTILSVDMDKGMTHLYAKTRGAARALNKIYETLENDYNKLGIKEIIIHHISAEEQAAQIKDYLEGKYPGIPLDICNIGPVIGLHVGPGTVGIVYYTINTDHKIE